MADRIDFAALEESTYPDRRVKPTTYTREELVRGCLAAMGPNRVLDEAVRLTIEVERLQGELADLRRANPLNPKEP